MAAEGLHHEPAEVWKKRGKKRRNCEWELDRLPSWASLLLSSRIPPPLTWSSWCLSEKPGESTGAFLLQLADFSWDTCSRKDLLRPGKGVLGTHRMGDGVMMAILPVEAYLPDWGFLTLL